MACRCGLVTAKREPVPLKSIAVELEVKDHVATVVSTLNYENKEDKPVEAVFVFPLPGDAAVCHFSATIGQTHIVAEVKEKQEAREDYDDALSSGQQAFLLEESEQSPDIFSLSVGSLPPGESASIRLEYVTELAVEADEGLRFCLPAVLNPRYTPRDSEAPSVAVTSVPASLIPYSLSFSGRLSSPRPISKVESTSSLEPLQYLNTEQTQATLKLAEGHKFDRDVELLIYYKDAHQPTAVVEAGQSSAEPGSLMGDPVVMVSLYPEFPQSVMSSMASCGEFVFLMDRSGSMQGSRIGSARDTLLLLLKSLPMGCYFNIYSFGSQFEYMFPKSVEYNQKTMEEALQKVGVMQANLGGTEILRPLEHIYSQPCIPGQPRQVFVFTDGEVWNTKEVTGLVKKNSGSHRCFSFGIGEGASSALINGLATEGNGRAQFITGSDRMQPKVMQSLRFALQPAVVDISVTWDLPKEVSIEVLSPPITTLFQGQRSLIYGRLRGQCAEEAESRVTVKYSLAGHPTENQLSFSLKPAADSGLTVHRLGARTLIRSLEAEERENRAGQDGGVKKKKATDLSIQSGVSSAFTSFIAVNKSNGKGIQGPLVKRHVSTPRMYMARTMSSPMAAPMADMKTSNQSRLPPPSPPPPAASNQSRLPPPPPPPAGCAGKKSSGGGISPEIMGMSKDLLSERRRRPNTCSNITLGPELFSYCSFDASPADLIGAGEASRDPLLQLISLQNAAGYWDQDEALASALGKTNEEVEKSKPAAVPGDVWATILALIWLHGFKMDAKEEWELLAMKAVSWLRVQNAPGVTESIDAGNALLGCSLQKAALGI